MGERFVAIGYRGQGIGFNGCVRLFAEENIVEYLDDLGQSGGAAAKNGIAMVNSVEVQRFVNIPRLGKAAGAKVVGPSDYATAVTTLKSGGDINYEGASGNVDLDANGDPVAPYDIWQVKSGAVTVVQSAVNPQ